MLVPYSKLFPPMLLNSVSKMPLRRRVSVIAKNFYINIARRKRGVPERSDCACRVESKKETSDR